MTFKSIDLQISIPRTPEASNLQSHLMHKPLVEQNKLADDAAKQTEMQRHKNTNIEETVGLNVHDQSSGSQEKQEQKKRKPQKAAPDHGEVSSSHPYKGKHIDISL
ncbi:hypothetical protein [Paenibacillus abyssi]|uniref:RNA polymerase subunit sigma n=1 Tax=Paenibacillus abyssi TaxID=1340531 RepID=A0A917FXF5_9BACL|nr:hypothetical protein [Paenibacillus abyssi]GGG12187.1 hypothetical protein GCM10010916_31320 [Paenibacillus abyssi]